jgi:molecular chaperone GrpE (heat shock protein)
MPIFRKNKIEKINLIKNKFDYTKILIVNQIQTQIQSNKIIKIMKKIKTIKFVKK